MHDEVSWFLIPEGLECTLSRPYHPGRCRRPLPCLGLLAIGSSAPSPREVPQAVGDGLRSSHPAPHLRMSFAPTRCRATHSGKGKTASYVRMAWLQQKPALEDIARDNPEPARCQAMYDQCPFP